MSRVILGTDEPTLSEANGVRYLHFGTEWIQGAMRLARPAELVFEYTRQMMAWLLFFEPPREAAIGLMGLGAGSLARFCLKQTASQLLVVEWNPLVSQVCHGFFRLPRTPRMDVVHDDAAHWAADPGNYGCCPVLMVDLYDAQARGPVRDSVAFYSDCRRVLGETGVLSVNLFGEHDSFPRNVANLETAFDGRLLMLPEIDTGNRIVLAFNGPPLTVTAERLLDRAKEIESRYRLPARRWAKALLGGQKNGALMV